MKIIEQVNKNGDIESGFDTSLSKTNFWKNKNKRKTPCTTSNIRRKKLFENAEYKFIKVIQKDAYMIYTNNTNQSSS